MTKYQMLQGFASRASLEREPLCEASDAKTRATSAANSDKARAPQGLQKAGIELPRRRCGTILIVEDDAAFRDALELLLADEGHRIISAPDAAEVTALLQGATPTPDVVIADYNLSGSKTGLEVIKSLRHTLHRQIPAIVLSGGITPDTLRMVTAEGCDYLHKPADIGQLTSRIETLLSAMTPQEPHAVRRETLLESTNIALAETRDTAKHPGARARAAASLAALTRRMRDVTDLVVED